MDANVEHLKIVGKNGEVLKRIQTGSTGLVFKYTTPKRKNFQSATKKQAVEIFGSMPILRIVKNME